MASLIHSVGLIGLDAFTVDVETDVSFGKFRFDIVGLPDTAVSESKERVRAALKNSGYEFSNNHITVNLAPADVRKIGPVYDLPILIAFLIATRQLLCPLHDAVFIGELSLAGEIRQVMGALPMVIHAQKEGFRRIFIPAENAAEASVVENIEIYAIHSVPELLNHLLGITPLEPITPIGMTQMEQQHTIHLDFEDVLGQTAARRAIEVAASGGHNILMIGSPGSGKSMLAKRIPSILPPLTFEEALETTKIYSVAGELYGQTGLMRERPFRSPHHSVSGPGLAGGGSPPAPGEVSLAHNGLLFLDELPEFSRHVMEILRQPMEDGQITISRATGSLTYPCSFMLAAAMNPCPCGYMGHPGKQCTCTKAAADHYLSRVSGPLLDRIDIHIEVPPVTYEHLSSKTKGESSAVIRERVLRVREIQNERFAGTGTTCNARMTPSQTRQYCILSDDAERLLRDLFDSLSLSARAYDKILRVSRTVADMDNSTIIQEPHIFEAIQYRSLDRKYRQ